MRKLKTRTWLSHVREDVDIAFQTIQLMSENTDREMRRRSPQTIEEIERELEATHSRE